MKEQILKIITPIKDFWAAQDRKKKLLIIGGAAGIVVAAIIVVAILNYTDYEVLYSGLEASEAAEIYSEIETMGIEVKLTSGGTISVPKEEANTLYAELAARGYPKNSMNYSIFTDNVSLFSTDFERREYARMQSQERLGQIIKNYDGVLDAAVTLNIPETKNTVISSSKATPSASVSVTLRDGMSLAPTQISGIQNIVAAAVTGLDPDSVVIIDGDLNYITADNALDIGDNLNVERQKLIFKQQYEETFRLAIIDLLGPGYGEENVKVAVNADLNYDKQVSELTEYRPSHDDGSGMVQHEDHSNSSGATNGDGDIVGVETNADDTYPTGDVGSSSVWSESSSSVSYLVTTLKQQTEKAGFSVDDLTVSVMIYTDTGFLSDDMKAELTSVVARATGVYEERVSVSSLSKFGTTPVIGPSTTGYPFNWSRQLYFVVMAAILAFIIVLLFVYINLSGKVKKKQRAYDKRIAKLRKAYQAQKMAYGIPEEDPNIPSLVARSEVETREEAIKREIEEFAHQNPAMVAQLIKSWIREEGNGDG